MMFKDVTAQDQYKSGCQDENPGLNLGLSRGHTQLSRGCTKPVEGVSPVLALSALPCWHAGPSTATCQFKKNKK